MKRSFPEGWAVEGTGGGCEWLRRGNVAITDGDAGAPEWGQPCAAVTLDENGDYDDGAPPRHYGTLEAALAFEGATAIPCGGGRSLYLYSGLTNGKLAWAADAAEFRRLVGGSEHAVRVAHAGIECPPGYYKPNGRLANDPIERTRP